jgi:hypothetical protein
MTGLMISGSVMKIDGHCHCGAISFEAEADPAGVVICHCNDCQRLSGSPYRAMLGVPAAAFSISGSPAIYIKVAESGRARAQAFCQQCGSAIYSVDVDQPTTFAVRLGVINQRRDMGAPARQIWCESALSWSEDLTGTPRITRQS